MDALVAAASAQVNQCTDSNASMAHERSAEVPRGDSRLGTGNIVDRTGKARGGEGVAVSGQAR
ncbi:uncharacterized protein B0H18DRAFT_1027919 [Fomitopsis serialis]|uniref:uncharacterized protein n=1 Tax=Fomitopsis serialis TaxID=139415 RepID=UPI002007C10D|nr:uncharacterized protein B0H18DRAFT_1027919 [Neoantrodia serialis]KAH9919398.1 hypothetical protein B0H18DRAFT_1027919 [Neoantrodia serialis]